MTRQSEGTIYTVTASLKFEIHFDFDFRTFHGHGTCASSILCTHEETERCLCPQQSLSDPSLTFFKLEDRDSLPNSDPESGLGLLPPPARRSKRLKVEVDIVSIEEMAPCGGDDKKVSQTSYQSTNGQGKGKGHNGKTTTSANTVFRVRSITKETQSNQVGSREALTHTCTLAGNVRRHQGDALLVPRTSGHHGL